MQEFATAAAATKYLTDYALNLGRFSGALATVPVDVHVQIEITATTSDAAFGVSFLLGNGSGSGATHPLFSSQIVG